MQPVRYVGPRVEDVAGNVPPEFKEISCEQICADCGAKILCQSSGIESVRSTAAKLDRGFQFCCQPCMDRIASKSKRSFIFGRRRRAGNF